MSGPHCAGHSEAVAGEGPPKESTGRAGRFEWIEFRVESCEPERTWIDKLYVAPLFRNLESDLGGSQPSGSLAL